MARHQQREESPLWPKLLFLIIICIVVGGALGYFQGTRLPGLLSARGDKPTKEAPAKTEEVNDKYSTMSRETLEKEVRRQAKALEAKDREIGDLTIKLKLAGAGSRTH